MSKNFLQIADYPASELQELLERAAKLKKLYNYGGRDTCLTGKTMAMLFEKPSSRTRISFQVGMTDLGGDTIYLRPEDIGGLGQREPIKDLTRVLNGYINVIVARTFAHDTVLELAKYAKVPVINALTDQCHPCQAMADLLTIQEKFGDIKELKLAFIGDGNNVAMSLAVACKKLGLHFVLACPKGYEMPDKFIKLLQQQQGDGSCKTIYDPNEAAKNANVVYTDTWTSMGQEKEKDQRIKDFTGFQVNTDLMAQADNNAIVMHCLPAYRDLEITNDVIESPQSVVFDQAENRLHFQRALLKYLLSQ